MESMVVQTTMPMTWTFATYLARAERDSNMTREVRSGSVETSDMRSSSAAAVSISAAAVSMSAAAVSASGMYVLFLSADTLSAVCVAALSDVNLSVESCLSLSIVVAVAAVFVAGDVVLCELRSRTIFKGW